MLLIFCCGLFVGVLLISCGRMWLDVADLLRQVACRSVAGLLRNVGVEEIWRGRDSGSKGLGIWAEVD